MIHLKISILSAAMLILFSSILAQFNQEWVVRLNGPNNWEDIAYSTVVDPTGNIYITGYNSISGALYDYTTIKYNASGIQLWLTRYNGPGNGIDKAYWMVLDAVGNVYVTGESVGNGTGADFTTIKYNSEGVQQWAARYNSQGSNVDVARSLAVDAAGNVYVTGYSGSSNNDITTVKYNSAGVQQWVKTYNGAGNAADRGASLVLDASGNVYVAGYVSGSGSETDCALIKYNTSGTQQWIQTYNGPGNGSDEATSAAMDGSGNIYITGYSTGSGTYQDYTTIKYNASGVQQWVNRYNGAGGTDIAKAIQVSSLGNVVITGYSGQGGTTGFDYVTIKYNTSGVQQWLSKYNGTGSNFDYAYSLATDADENVYVTGASRSGTDIVTNDYATVKYNSAGSQQWVARYNGTGNAEDQAYSIAIDAQRNVIITGGSRGNGSDYDYVTIKYSQPSGIQQISNEFPDKFALSQNYPNPFNPQTKLTFSVTKKTEVKISVYDALGNQIEVLVNQILQPGIYMTEFNGSSQASGIYFCRMEAGSYKDVKKMILIK